MALPERLAFDPMLGDVEAWNPRRPLLLAHLRELAAAHPDDVWIQQQLQNAVRMESAIDPELGRDLELAYEARCRAEPSDPVALYLHATWLPDDAQLRALDELVALHPSFPWGYLARARARFNVEQEEGMAAVTADLFRAAELCPERIASALSFWAFLRRDDAGPRLSWLRALCEAAPLADRLACFPALWSLELRLAPVDQHPVLRRRVREDVGAVEELGLEGVPRWWRVLAQGYELAGDVEMRSRLRARAEASDPCSAFVAADRQRELFAQPLEQRTATERRQVLDALWRWSRECPDGFYERSLLNVAGHVSDLAADDVRRTVDAGLRSWNRARFFVRGYHGDAHHAAKLLVEHGLDLEHAIDLASEEMSWQQAFPAEQTPVPDDAPDELRKSVELALVRQTLENTSLTAEARIRLGRLSEARTDLESLDAARSELASRDRDARDRQRHDANVHRLRGELALAEGRPADALAAFLEAERLDPAAAKKSRARLAWQALGGSPGALSWLRGTQGMGGEKLFDRLHVTPTAPEVPPGESTPVQALSASPNADQLVGLLRDGHDSRDSQRRASQAWASLGGTEQSLDLLRRALAEAPARATAAWRAMETELPDFTLVDVEGRTWRREELKGKLVLANVWASWCAPCRMELPFFEQAAAKLATHDDVLVLTFNADDSPGLVAPFLAREEIRLPALLASEYLREHDTLAYALPTSWIVDRDGIIRWATVGFDPSRAQAWVEETVRAVEQLRRSSR